MNETTCAKCNRTILSSESSLLCSKCDREEELGGHREGCNPGDYWPDDCDCNLDGPRPLEFLRGNEAPKEEDEDQDIPF